VNVFRLTGLPTMVVDSRVSVVILVDVSDSILRSKLKDDKVINKVVR
jgi:hypothetical protein